MICGICGETGETTKHSFDGKQVHEGCYNKRRRRSKRQSDTKQLTRMLKRSKPEGMNLKSWAMETQEGRNWLKRKKG